MQLLEERPRRVTAATHKINLRVSSESGDQSAHHYPAVRKDVAPQRASATRPTGPKRIALHIGALAARGFLRIQSILLQSWWGAAARQTWRSSCCAVRFRRGLRGYTQEHAPVSRVQRYCITVCVANSESSLIVVRSGYGCPRMWDAACRQQSAAADVRRKSTNGATTGPRY